jgi:uncharacterized protein YcbX
MAKHQVGVVRELWRYPVKSMLGERLDQFCATESGVAGDRTWALRDPRGGNILSAKKWPRLLDFQAHYQTPPDGGTGEVLIRVPDGKTVRADDPHASSAISEALGYQVKLERAQAGVKSKAEIDTSTIFGDVPVEQIFPNWTAATMPNVFKLPLGTFFDSAVVHVLASGTLEHIRGLSPQGTVIDPRRYRPNILIATLPELTGFIEDAWSGRILEVGEALRIVAIEPALRCVMTTHRQSDLPRDLGVLRTAAQHHEAKVGVFASIGAAGTVRLGDPVFIAD